MERKLQELLHYPNKISKAMEILEYFDKIKYDLNETEETRLFCLTGGVDIFISYLKSSNYKSSGSSQDLIEKVINDLNIKTLPLEYLKFLKYGGNQTNFIQSNVTHYQTEELKDIQLSAKNQIKEHNTYWNSNNELTNNEFVIALRFDHEFYFIKLDEGSNPPVYFYSEGEKFIKVYNSFTEYLVSLYIQSRN